MNSIFIEGWIPNTLLFAVVYFLAEYATYKIIFRQLVSTPKSYNYRELRHWNRKASFIGAVIFAPLYEEVMFTYLAYATFLHYTQPGQEGIVIIFVASFFALLHLPGDLKQQRHSSAGINLYNLIVYQSQRFFYSLTAYFIYVETQALWITILIHYFYNAFVSVYQFDMEDQIFPVEKTDIYLLLIFLMNICFGPIACYYFFNYYPNLVVYIALLMGFMLLNYIREFRSI